MELILILGPMKSGKSFELIGHFMPLRYTDIAYGIYQSSKNVRDKNVWSRNGAMLASQKVDDLSEILDKDQRIVGIDEVHMFDEKDIEIVKELLKRGVKVIASGLDTDYRGEMFPSVKRLLELGPKEIKYKRAVCEICKKPDAIYTQIFNGGCPILEGLSSVLPDDGTYAYKPVCRNCFVKN
jgi:thymidine kinase